jgi:hypothetical protein
MDDSLNYHCRDIVCGRGLPRQTAYCPYCGTRQQVVPLLAKPEPELPTVAPAPVSAPIYAPVSAPASASTSTPASAPAPRPAPTKIPPFVPKSPKSKGWLRWVIVAGMLILVWNLVSKPKQSDSNQSKVAAIQAAVKSAVEACDLTLAGQKMQDLQDLQAFIPIDAQAYRALENQLKQAKPACEKKLEKKRDWEKTQAMINNALNEGLFEKTTYDKLVGRLNWYKNTWKEADDDGGGGIRELRNRLDAGYALRLLELAERCQEKEPPDTDCVKQRLKQWERLKQTEGRERVMRLLEQLGEQ